MFSGQPVETTQRSIVLERWQQDGASLINIHWDDDVMNDETIYTVTAGKTLYITQIIFTDTDSDEFRFDDGQGGTTKMTFDGMDNTYSPHTINFKTPLKFETSVWFEEVGVITSFKFIMVGWEE